MSLDVSKYLSRCELYLDDLSAITGSFVGRILWDFAIQEDEL